ncbi:MAG: hypothetical protein QF464_00205 [Myxococcota bacterium]|jgi:murein L,D-transpeptidase YafK|nr:hypothetical protein [Myxococcota bacterium]
MARILLGILSLALVVTGPSVSPPADAGTFLSRQLRAPRVRAALQAQGARVHDDFLRAGAAWPPSELFMRAFKHESVLEVWAAGAEHPGLVRVWSIPLCATSGALGPKRQEGDGQIPEGVYRVNRFNPRSSFHLSLGLDYPNAVDRARAGEGDPGSDIFVHGDCVTIGCLTIEDGPIERVYLAAIMARDQGQRGLPVHLFPCRFGEARCEATLAAEVQHDPSLAPLWRSLRSVHDAFEPTRVVPRVRVTRSGYRLR